MNKDHLNYLAKAILFIIIELFVMARLDLGFYLSVHIYFYFLVLLPVNVEKHAILLIAFLVGIIVDQALNTGGIHAAASLVSIYLRPMLVKAYGPREGLGKPDYLTLFNFGIVNFILYVLSIVLIHQTMFVLLESFSIISFGFMVLKILAGTISTTILYLAIHLIAVRRSST